MTVVRVALVALASTAVALAVFELVRLSIPAQALVDVDSGLNGVAALAVALVAGVLVTAGALTPAGRSRGARIAAGVLALAIVVGLAYLLFPNVLVMGMDWVGLALGPALMLGLGLVVAIVMAAHPPASVALGRGPRALAIVLAIAGVLVRGQPLVWEALEEYREQRLPAFTVELAAAYRYDLSPDLPAIVVDSRGEIGEILTFRGVQFNVHHDNALSIASSDVRRVRWISDGDDAVVTLRLDGEVRDAYRARDRSRGSQHDAVFIDGEPRLLSFYGLNWPSDRVVLWDPDRAALWRVYRRLTDVGSQRR